MKFLTTSMIVVALGLGAVLLGLYYYSQNAPERAEAIDRPAVNAPVIFTPEPVIDAMIEMAEVTATDFVLDLGCGDGRILIAAAKKTGCKGVGYDLDAKLIEQSRQKAIDEGVDHLVTFEVKDIKTLDMSNASVIMMYLLPDLQKEMIPQFQRMKAGSRLVSHDNGIGDIHDLPPEKQVEVIANEIEVHYVFMWTVPLNISER